MRCCGRKCSGRWNDCARCLRLRANARSKTATANFQRKKKSFCETASERRRADFTTEATEEEHRKRGDSRRAEQAPPLQSKKKIDADYFWRVCLPSSTRVNGSEP